MSSLTRKEVYLNLYLNGDIQDEDIDAISKFFKTKSFTDYGTSDNRHLFIDVGETLPLHDLNYVLGKLPTIEYNLIINFIGNDWVENDKFGTFATTVYAATKNHQVSFNLIDFDENSDFKVKPISLKYKTLTVSKESNYIVPNEALPHFNFEVRNNLEDVFAVVTTPRTYFDKVECQFIIYNTYRILDNGLDPKYTVAISQIADSFYNIGIATQVTPGIIQSALLEINEDMLLRNCANLSNITDYGSRYDSLVTKGYLKEIGESDAGYHYKLTDKGLAYNRNSATRRSVRSGVAVDDVIINILTGIKYKVMSFHNVTGEYNLMSENFNAESINIITDTTHFFAHPEEVKALEEKIAS